MDNKIFSDFARSVFDHNFKMQKEIEKNDDALVIRKLKEYVEKYPLANIYLHYPKDEQTENILFCYSFGMDNETQLIPVLSTYLSEEKIILSYLPQKELDKLDFSMKLPIHEHYTNAENLKKYFEKDNFNFYIQNHSMIFMEHIPDSLNWKYDCPEHKIFRSFAFTGISSLMLWSGLYFTPHY